MHQHSQLYLALYYQRVRSALAMKYENKENESMFTYTALWLFVGVHIY